MNATTLLSIITVVKNDRIGLIKTLKSVLNKKPSWCEYIVIDGASTDGTCEVLEKYQNCVDVAISEQDGGIANAFNKGVCRASGEYLLFLNAGDALCGDVFSNVYAAIVGAKEKGIWVLAYRVRLLVGDEGRIIGQSVSKQRQLLRNYLPHQGMLIASEAFEHLGLYNESYHLGMDYEWSLRLYPHWHRVQFEKTVLSEMNADGVSMKFFRKTFQSYHRARLEHHTMPSFLSSLIAVFFITKRTAGEYFRNR